MKELLKAVRQYRHNNGDGLLIGYDRVETGRVVSELLRERNELAAQVERLRGALSDLEDDCKKCADTHGLDVYADLCESAANACRVMDETPAQSLEAVKREWLAEFVESARRGAEYGLGDSLAIGIDELYEIADL